jgi:hypothetical protein
LKREVGELRERAIELKYGVSTHGEEMGCGGWSWWDGCCSWSEVGDGDNDLEKNDETCITEKEKEGDKMA